MAMVVKYMSFFDESTKKAQDAATKNAGEDKAAASPQAVISSAGALVAKLATAVALVQGKINKADIDVTAGSDQGPKKP